MFYYFMMSILDHISILKKKFILDVHTKYNLGSINKNMKQLQSGGATISTKRHYYADIGGVYTFICNFEEDESSVVITIVTDNEKDCAFINIDKENHMAVVANMTYFDNCAKEGLMRPGGGSILFRFILNLILWYKTKYAIKRVMLTDNSNLACKSGSKSVKLARLKMITNNRTWYMRYGFKPFDAYKMAPDVNFHKRLKETDYLVSKVSLKSLDIVSMAKELYGKKDVYVIEQLVGKYENDSVKDFVRY